MQCDNQATDKTLVAWVAAQMQDHNMDQLGHNGCIRTV